MNQTSYLRLVLIFVAVLSACHSKSLHPLSGPTDTKYDERLLGTWITKGQHEGDIAYLPFGRGENGPIVAIWVAHEKAGGTHAAIFRIIPTEIENQNYPSVQMVDPKSLEKDGTGYFFVKYSIDKEQKLTLWDMDLGRAISSRKLKADGGKVTDSTSMLRDFVRSADPNELFPSQELIFVFKKKDRKALPGHTPCSTFFSQQESGCSSLIRHLDTHSILSDTAPL